MEDFNAIHKNEGGLGGASKIEPRKGDCAMVIAAIKQRWPISKANRKAVKTKLMNALETCDSPRDFAAISKCLIAMEAQNQADELQALKDRRLDEGKPTENTTHTITVSFDE